LWRNVADITFEAFACPCYMGPVDRRWVALVLGNEDRAEVCVWKLSRSVSYVEWKRDTRTMLFMTNPGLYSCIHAHIAFSVSLFIAA
jgi:hypothetical protein